MPSEQERIEDAYSRYGEDRRYRSRWGRQPGNALISQRRQELLVSLLREHFADFAGVQILDLGCGCGLVLEQLTGLGFLARRMVGLDIRLKRMKQSSSDLPQLSFVCGDASAICFPGSCFDLIIMYTALSSVLDASLRTGIGLELLRIVKDEGIIIS